MNASKTKRSNPKRGAGAATDWGKLLRRSAVSIRKGIAGDTESHATDAEFWKSAKVVMPTQK